MRALPRALRLYLWAIYACGFLLVASSLAPYRAVSYLRQLSPATVTTALIFLVLAGAGEIVLLQTSANISQSLATTAQIAAILLLPPPLPLLITLAAVTFSQCFTRKPLYKRFYNICHTSLAVGLTGALCARIAGPFVVLRDGAARSTLLREHHTSMAPLLLLIGAYYACDAGMMLGLLTIIERRAPWRIWWQRQTPSLWPELGASTMGVVAAVAWLFNPFLIALFLSPIVALRIAFRAIEHAEDRAAALRQRSEQLEVVLAAGQQLQLQHTQVELLAPVAAAARSIAGAAVVGAYLRDPDHPALLQRLIVLPPDADDAGPARLAPPEAMPQRGMPRQADGSLLVPLQYCDGAVVSLLRLAGIEGALGHDTRDTLTILATQAAIALENAEMHEQALARASEDSLTGLLNHRAFQVRLEEEARQHAADRRPLSLVMVDLDNFGDINNRFGHQIGDAALTVIASALRAHLRAADSAARYGGDEFAIILPDTAMAEALAVAERLRATIADLAVAAGGLFIRVGASLGVASLPEHARTREELVRAADQAAYAAKHAGKGRIGRPEDVALAFDRDLAQLTAQLEHANMATVEALAAAVDAKDSYTRGHSQRVGAYATAIAEVLGYGTADLARVRLAGLLHDVGKIGVPDAILCKPGKLTDEEYTLLQRHSAIGESMLRAVPFLRDVLPAVRHHHERWDGAGYPDRLAGEAIPRDAAILAVADAFDAMTTSRIYRAPIPVVEACRRICEGSRTQFSPEVVAAFNRACGEGLLRVQGDAALLSIGQIA